MITVFLHHHVSAGSSSVIRSDAPVAARSSGADGTTEIQYLPAVQPDIQRSVRAEHEAINYIVRHAEAHRPIVSPGVALAVPTGGDYEGAVPSATECKCW